MPSGCFSMIILKTIFVVLNRLTITFRCAKIDKTIGSSKRRFPFYLRQTTQQVNTPLERIFNPVRPGLL